jgi:hypothetical protein
LSAALFSGTHAVVRHRDRPQTRYLRRIRARQGARLGTPSSSRREPRLATVECPKRLSLVDAPNEAIKFFNSVLRERKADRLFIDAGAVEAMTPDGLLLLLIAIKRCRNVAGNLPTAAGPRKLMQRSGFQNHVSTQRWRPQSTHGLIEQKGTRADGELAARVVKLACEKMGIPPKSDRYCYKIILECMANTRNHASGSEERPSEDWYMQVYYDHTREVACYCFADLGKGIIETLNLDPSDVVRAAVSVVLPIEGHTGILKRVLSGEIKSSTRKAGRGLGLPKIASLRKDGLLRRLVIVANRAHLDHGGASIEVLETRQGFSGTLLYWEVGKPRTHDDAQLQLAFGHG